MNLHSFVTTFAGTVADSDEALPIVLKRDSTDSFFPKLLVSAATSGCGTAASVLVEVLLPDWFIAGPP